MSHLSQSLLSTLAHRERVGETLCSPACLCKSKKQKSNLVSPQEKWIQTWDSTFLRLFACKEVSSNHLCYFLFSRHPRLCHEEVGDWLEPQDLMYSLNLGLLTAHIHLNKNWISRSHHATRIITDRMYEIFKIHYFLCSFSLYQAWMTRKVQKVIADA